MNLFGTVILAHGSRRPEVADAFSGLVRSVARTMPEILVRGAFFSLGRPTMAEVVDELVALGCSRIAVLPYFLFNGVHTLSDIPALIDDLRTVHENVEFELLPGLENDPLLVRLVTDRIQDAQS